MSLVEIAAQMSRQRRDGKETAKTGKKIFIISGLAIIFAAGLAVGAYYLFFNKETPVEIPVANVPQPIVFSDKKEVIRLKSEKREDLIDSIQKTAGALIPINTILSASFSLETPKNESTGQAAGKTEFLNSRRFLEILKIALPANLMQSLEENFTFGVYYFKKNNSFLIFKIRSFDLAFSGILDWEKNMANDLKDILSISIPTDQKFQDKIINNRDTRVLYDTNGNPILIYSFFSTQYLIISVDLETFNEIISRLSIPR